MPRTRTSGRRRRRQAEPLALRTARRFVAAEPGDGLLDAVGTDWSTATPDEAVAAMLQGFALATSAIYQLAEYMGRPAAMVLEDLWAEPPDERWLR